MLYLDHNASTPIDPAVRDEMNACLERTFGNPASLHAQGQEARRVLDRARMRVARLIHARPDEIVFTGGGTEADNLAVFGAAAIHPDRRHMLVSSVEHQAVLNPCKQLAAQGYEVNWIAVDEQGRADPDAIAAAVRDDTALISVMLANNETGVLMPIAQLAALKRPSTTLLHTDAVQAVGKIPIDVRELGVDLLSLSGHKIYGPKGVGALYVRAGVKLKPVLFGGHQERSLRPGTENVPAIAALGKACDLAAKRLEEDALRLTALRQSFEQAVLERIPGTRVNGDTVDRLPNTASILFPDISAEMLAINLDLLGVAVSTGSACSTADKEPSHVLVAMGRSADEARSTIRFSFGRANTSEDVQDAVDRVCQAVTGLQEIS